jgi:fumarylacetoacetate (FAA) hydrolase
MKLATLKDGSRDGVLLVVARDLRTCHLADDIAPRLQAALDNWGYFAPLLQDLYAALNAGKAQRPIAFEPKNLMSPLPRAYQWADGSAYVNHVELVRKARKAEMPKSFWTDPLMYQGGSDGFLGPCDDIVADNEAWGIDFEGEVAVITDDVPMQVKADKAREHIRLLMLVNDVSLRNLIPNELAKGFGFFQGKPASSFSPVAVTPDELGAAWDGAKLHLPLSVQLNGKPFGAPNAGIDMTFDFGDLIAHAAKTRTLAAGSIIGSGTVSNVDRSAGSACIAEVRMLETIAGGKPETPFMKFGDRVKIEMFTDDGASIFGAIDQQVAPLRKPRRSAEAEAEPHELQQKLEQKA